MADKLTTAGVTVSEMQDYLAVDGDDSLIENLISTAEAVSMNSIGRTQTIDYYRSLPNFNQCVRILVDFWYFNRGLTDSIEMAYPHTYQMLLNTIRFKTGDGDENSNTKA